MQWRNGCLGLLLVILPYFLSAQSVWYKYDLGVNMHPGFLIAHRADSKNLEAHTWGFEVQMTRKNYHNQKAYTWAHEYRDPRVGINILYMNLGKPDLTGQVFAVIPNFETALATMEHSVLSLRAGTGIGYLTQKFDPQTNRRNQAIGSHLNGAMQLMLSWNRRYGRLESKLGLAITHFSNGAFRVPNLGVNMPGAVVGLNYNFGKAAQPYPAYDTFPFRRFLISSSFAFREHILADPHPFYIFSLNGTMLKRINYIRDWRFGTDLFFDKTHHYMEFPEDDLKGLLPWEMTEVGLFAGHQWMINRAHLVADIGIYAYKPSAHKYITYQRLGIFLYATDHIFFRSTLKIHFGVADFFDWGVGYRFDNR